MRVLGLLVVSHLPSFQTDLYITMFCCETSQLRPWTDQFVWHQGTRLSLVWWLRILALDSGRSFLLVFQNILLIDVWLERSYDHPIGAVDLVAGGVSSPE